jgi:hypothetical protein
MEHLKYETRTNVQQMSQKLSMTTSTVAHKPSKNLGVTAKFSEPEGWQEASSILITHKH